MTMMWRNELSHTVDGNGQDCSLLGNRLVVVYMLNLELHYDSAISLLGAGLPNN